MVAGPVIDDGPIIWYLFDMGRQKREPYIYKREGRRQWFAFLDSNRKHISLRTEDQREALGRLSALVAEPPPPPEMRNRKRRKWREVISGPVVYFVQAGIGGNVKIGRTGNLKTRLQSLKTAHAEKMILLGVLKDEPGVEKQMHAIFDKERIDREWFRPSLEMMRFISSHVVRPR